MFMWIYNLKYLLLYTVFKIPVQQCMIELKWILLQHSGENRNPCISKPVGMSKITGLVWWVDETYC